MVFLHRGSPSCHLPSSKPRCGCHSSGVALPSYPQVGPFELPAAKPKDAQNHLQCLKWRTCSLLLGTSTATSSQQSKAKIPGRNACGDGRGMRVYPLNTQRQVALLVLPLTSEVLRSPLIFVPSSACLCCQLFGQWLLWRHTWRASSPTGAAPCEQQGPGGSTDMTWSDRKGGRQPRPGKLPRLCFWFSSCTIKEVSEFLLNGFQNLLQGKKKKKKNNPVHLHLRLIITGIIMNYSHHKSWRKKRILKFARFAGWQKENTALIALLCCV